MIRKIARVLAGLALLASAYWRGTPVASAAQGTPAPREEITAALPVIPAAKFQLADYGAVGDG